MSSRSFAAYRLHERISQPRYPTARWNAGRNDQAQRFATFGGRAGRPDLVGQQLLDARELVEIDVNNFGAVLQVEAGVVTMEAAARREVAPKTLEDWM
jgi:hypothetical protein